MSESESVRLVQAASLEIRASVTEAMRQAEALDHRYSTDYVRRTVRQVVAAWAMAVDGDGSGLAAITDPPARPALIYPARGIAELWQPAPTTHSQALSHLLGQTRAALLESLAEPASTHTLARRHELAPSTVSEHLAILHHAHLITRRRHRHTVLYQQTPLGAELAHGSYARGTTGWLSGPLEAMRKGLTSWPAQCACSRC